MAARYFELATQLDPSYALAWVGLSRARKWQAVSGLIPKEEGYRVARETKAPCMGRHFRSALLAFGPPCSFSVPGYHFHFLSADRQKGGHVMVPCDQLPQCGIRVFFPTKRDFLSFSVALDKVRSTQSITNPPGGAGL